MAKARGGRAVPVAPRAQYGVGGGVVSEKPDLAVSMKQMLKRKGGSK